MDEPALTFEHAGLLVEIHGDDSQSSDPQDNDNAGTIYSWDRSFDGDERIVEPEMEIPCPKCDHEDPDCCSGCGGTGTVDVTIEGYMAHNYDAALTIGLRYSDYGSSGARLYLDADDPNCAICFTQKEIDHEWSGHVEPYPIPVRAADGSSTGETELGGGARAYAKARVNEMDEWLQGYVYGYVIKNADGSDIVPAKLGDSCWGFIGDILVGPANPEPYIFSEAKAAAEGVAEDIKREAELVFEWACRDVVTV